MNAVYTSKMWIFLRRLLASPVVLALLFILLVAPLIYLSRYDHPISDDFLNVVWTSIWQKQKEIYTQWSGRYFSTFLLSFTPMHWGSVTGYRIIIGINVFIVCLAILLGVRKMLTEFTGLGKATRNVISLFALALAINNLPSIGEAFYWYPGALAYTVTIAFCTVLIFTFTADNKNSGLHYSKRNLTIEIITVFAIIGSNETMMVFIDIICFCLYVYYRLQNRKNLQRQYLILLAFAALFSAVAIFAPGNGVRQNLSHPNRITAVALWSFFTKELLLSWIYQPFFLIFTLLLCLVPNARIITPFRTNNVLLFFFITIFIVYVMMFPGYWAAGTMPPGRAVNTVYIIFLGFWIYFVLLVRMYVINITTWKPTSFPNEAVLVVSIILIASLITTSAARSTNYVKMLMLIQRKTPQRYDAEIKARYRILSGATGDSVGIPYIRSRAGNFLMYEDLWSVPNSWPNSAYEKYWKKKYVYLSDTVSIPAY